MKYPYITGNEVSSFVVYEQGQMLLIGDESNGFSRGLKATTNETNQPNTTKEVLANTYGKVESKEHAEFIKLLAETNGMPCGAVSIDLNYKVFYVIDECLFFCVEEIDAVGDYKEITIPLPPKQESGLYKGISEYDLLHGAPYGGPIGDGGAYLVGGDSSNTESNSKTADSDEWPKLGDEVLIDISDYDVVYGQNIDGLICKVLSIFKDGGATVYVVNRDGVNYCFVRDLLKKPKTPEEELRDFLELLWRENNHDFSDFLDIAMKHIKKKPQ